MNNFDPQHHQILLVDGELSHAPIGAAAEQESSIEQTTMMSVALRNLSTNPNEQNVAYAKALFGRLINNMPVKILTETFSFGLSKLKIKLSKSEINFLSDSFKPMTKFLSLSSIDSLKCVSKNLNEHFNKKSNWKIVAQNYHIEFDKKEEIRESCLKLIDFFKKAHSSISMDGGFSPFEKLPESVVLDNSEKLCIPQHAVFEEFDKLGMCIQENRNNFDRFIMYAFATDLEMTMRLIFDIGLKPGMEAIEFIFLILTQSNREWDFHKNNINSELNKEDLIEIFINIFKKAEIDDFMKYNILIALLNINPINVLSYLHDNKIPLSNPISYQDQEIIKIIAAYDSKDDDFLGFNMHVNELLNRFKKYPTAAHIIIEKITSIKEDASIDDVERTVRPQKVMAKSLI